MRNMEYGLRIRLSKFDRILPSFKSSLKYDFFYLREIFGFTTNILQLNYFMDH